MSFGALAFNYPLQHPITQSCPDDDCYDALSVSWGALSDSLTHQGAPFDATIDDPPHLDLLHTRADDPWLSSGATCFSPTQSAELSVSPAALFLSAFTPPSSNSRLPDDEGESVAGYVLGPVIGYGGFSTIKRASSPSGGVVAIKIVKRSELERQSNPSLTRKRLDHETQIWSSLSHEHILPLFTTEHTAYADFFITLYCPAGSLFSILKRDGSPALPHDDAGMMFRQVVRGVRYLHEVAGYVHRDIKLENVLVDEMGVCRIGDFGLARRIGETDDEELDDEGTLHRHRSTIMHTRRRAKELLPSHASVHRHHHPSRRHRTSTPIDGQSPAPVHPAHAFHTGSLPYVAPELLAPSSSFRCHGAHPSQDMWALGVLLYALLTGSLPFSDPFEPRLTVKILHGAFDMPQDIGRGADRVLRGCLERSVSNRWTIAMVDEVAWGIGWGEEVDDSSPVAPNFVDYTSHPSPSSRSKSPSRSRLPHHLDPDDAAVSSRRSRRSLSRASVTTTSSLSTRSTSRSMSRPPLMTRLPFSPEPQDLSHSVLSASTSLSSRPPLDLRGDSALLASPNSSAFERGRRPKRADFTAASRCAPSLMSATRFELGRELSPSRRGLYSNACEDTSRWACSLELDPPAQAATSASPSAAVAKLRAMQVIVDSQHATQRSGSAPPTSSECASAWPRGVAADGHVSAPALTRPTLISGGGVRNGFLREPSATPIPIARGRARRSRSVGFGRDPDAAAVTRRRA